MPTSYQKGLNQQSENFTFMLSFHQSLSVVTFNNIFVYLPDYLVIQ